MRASQPVSQVRLSARLLAAFTLHAIACSAPPPRAIRYEGVAVNRESSAEPSLNAIAGSLTIITTTSGDSLLTGEVLIGAPLGGSGHAELSPWDDSLLVISYSPTGDTILWLGAREGSAYVGSYLIAGGPYAGQGGHWSARQASTQAFESGEPPDVELRDWLTRELVRLEGTAATPELDLGRENIEAPTARAPGP